MHSFNDDDWLKIAKTIAELLTALLGIIAVRTDFKKEVRDPASQEVKKVLTDGGYIYMVFLFFVAVVTVTLARCDENVKDRKDKDSISAISDSMSILLDSTKSQLNKQLEVIKTTNGNIENANRKIDSVLGVTDTLIANQFKRNTEKQQDIMRITKSSVDSLDGITKVLENIKVKEASSFDTLRQVTTSLSQIRNDIGGVKKDVKAGQFPAKNFQVSIKIKYQLNHSMPNEASLHYSTMENFIRPGPDPNNWRHQFYEYELNLDSFCLIFSSQQYDGVVKVKDYEDLESLFRIDESNSISFNADRSCQTPKIRYSLGWKKGAYYYTKHDSCINLEWTCTMDQGHSNSSRIDNMKSLLDSTFLQITLKGYACGERSSLDFIFPFQLSAKHPVPFRYRIISRYICESPILKINNGVETEFPLPPSYLNEPAIVLTPDKMMEIEDGLLRIYTNNIF